jgi:hypothetical protein
MLLHLYLEGNACDLIRSATRTRLDDCIASWTDYIGFRRERNNGMKK